MNPDPIQLIDVTFSDFDELASAIRGWNLELFKLDTHPFLGRIFHILHTDFILTRGTFRSDLKQLAAPPAGFLTFVIPANPNLDMRLRSQPVRGNNLMIFPEGGEIHAFTQQSFDVYTLSVREASLLQMAEDLGFINFSRYFRGLELLIYRNETMNELRGMLQGLEKSPKLPNIGKLLLVYLVLTIGAPHKAASISQSCGFGWVQKIDELIYGHPDEKHSIAKFSADHAINRRVLEYTFNKEFGIAPKTYINRMRLNEARRAIRSGECQSIVEAANAWGFWHMGQFAKDYRKLFGELPSQTLKQSV